ncbi:MAG: AAA family ATPase [Streptosporangiaceae bacterium]
MTHDQPLLDLVFDRLAADSVPDGTATLVLAAYAGQEQLDAALAGEDPDLPEFGAGAGQPNRHLYLESVSVAGFRGVGPQASLRLAAQPGLTLVAGRNGSGKSSFAEAAEFALTGASARWSGQSLFREGWRNLHSASPGRIQVTARADGAATPIRITRTWREGDTQPEDASGSVAAEGKHFRSPAELGWSPALETYRPFLNASDFGRLISSAPSTLFDALAPLLGIDSITGADKRLMQARKALDDRLKQVRLTREALRDQLALVDDERARDAAAILSKRRPDLEALSGLLATASETASDPVAAVCRRLVDAAIPEPQEAAELAGALDTAAHDAAAITASSSHVAHQAAQILELALAYHDSHGDGPCPACGSRLLDASWREEANPALSQLRSAASAAQQATQHLGEASDRARAFLSRTTLWPPADAETAALGPPLEVLHMEQANWTAVPRDASPQQLAEHLRAAYPAFHRAFVQAQATAADWLRARHDTWREHASALQSWLAEARQAADDEPTLSRIKSAREWLKTATDEIRAARLAPFAQRSQEIWEQLRQESNIELAGMRLDGSSTRRRVAFPVTVDGTAAQAMAVMSEGELQALGLAVFLPRACADASPFRFLIIDDPVHSLDPSKVDGLAQVLADLARHRQVIVFSHDDRLPQAVRRLEIDATIWEVKRREGSVVELRKNLDPVRRYLDDALALAKTAELAEDVRRPVVAGFCRSAIEAACHDRVRRDRLGRGESHAAVDALIEGARTLNQTAALALFGDAREGGRVMPMLNQVGRWAADAFAACRDDVHGGTHGPLESLVDDTSRLIGRLR